MSSSVFFVIRQDFLGVEQIFYYRQIFRNLATFHVWGQNLQVSVKFLLHPTRVFEVCRDFLAREIFQVELASAPTRRISVCGQNF